MEENKIPLNEMIQTLRAEISQAQESAENSALKFSLESVELELSVSVSKAAGGKGGIKFWVLEAGGDYQKENIAVHKFKLTLKPGAGKDIQVSNKTNKKISDQ